MAIQKTPRQSIAHYLDISGSVCIGSYVQFYFQTQTNNRYQSQVIQNTVHVTASGVFATYYFYGTSTGGQVTVPVENPTAKSAKRALTTSFGSICFGSLIIAIIRFLKQMATNARNDSARDGNVALAIFACIFACILQCIGDILNYFNHVSLFFDLW